MLKKIDFSNLSEFQEAMLVDVMSEFCELYDKRILLNGGSVDDLGFSSDFDCIFHAFIVAVCEYRSCVGHLEKRLARDGGVYD